MRRYILSVWALACLLAYCSGPEATEDLNTKKTSGSEMSAFPMRINGEAGYLYVDVKGDGGVPIVFAHSFGGSAEHWKNQMMHYSRTRKVVTFDFRGHGRSDSAATPVYSPRDMAQDIATVVDFMQLKKFILVGHSMGGSAAIAYAAQHPEKIAALVLVGTPGKSSPEEAKKIMSSLKSPAYQKVMDDYMKQLLTNAKPEVDAMVMQEFLKTSRSTTIAVTGSIFDFDPLPKLEKYKGPLLIVLTDKENNQPQALAKQVPRAKSMVITGTSHWIQLDKPQDFNKVLDDFLKENNL